MKCNTLAITDFFKVFKRKQKPNLKTLRADCYMPLCMLVAEAIGDYDKAEEIVATVFQSLEENPNCFANDEAAFAFLERGLMREIEALCGELDDPIPFNRKTLKNMSRVMEEAEYSLAEDWIETQCREIGEEALKIAIEKLPPRQRAVIKLILKNYETHMVAQDQNIQKRTVLNTKNIAIQKLLKAMAEQGILVVLLMISNVL